MSRSVLCRLGFHDWEYLVLEHPQNIWNEMNGTGLRIEGGGTFEFAHDRVCLRCRTRDNQIPAALSKIDSYERNKRMRREIAQNIAREQ